MNYLKDGVNRCGINNSKALCVEINPLKITNQLFEKVKYVKSG